MVASDGRLPTEKATGQEAQNATAALTDARSVLAAVDTDKSALSLSLRVPQNGVSHCHRRTNSVRNDVAISD